MNKIGKKSYKVHTYEVDALGRMSLPVLGSILQESASRHANELGWGYASLIQNNAIWVLTALKIEMNQDPHWNDTLTIHTWPSGRNRLFYYRDFTIFNQNETTLGKATTNWIIIDINTRKPIRLEIPEPFDFSELETMFEEPPRKWPVPETLQVAETVQVRFDDLDINNHVNNIRYFDWMLRSLDSEFRRTHRLHTFEIHFISEAMDQEKIQILLHHEGNGCQHLLKRESDGKAIAQAGSIWQPL